MTYDEMSDAVKSYFIEAFGTETSVKNVIKSYEKEGEQVINLSGLFIPADLSLSEMEVLKSLYSEYKIYVCMANDVLAEFRRKDFYKLIEELQARKEERQKNGTYDVDGDGNGLVTGVIVFNE